MTPIWTGRGAEGRGALPLAPLRDWFLDAVWPPTCPVSGAPVDRSGHLSPERWQALSFLAAPWCESCGFPFPYPGGSGAGSAGVCGACIAKPPVFDHVRAPLAYDDASRALVLGFKNGGRREMLHQFAAWMALAARDRLARADMLVPVPLHWRRLIARRYNQSALLGRALSQHTGLPLVSDVLARRRATPSQAGRSVDGRRRNVAGAFQILDRAALDGRHVVLVDDVFTTGATVTACARQLKKAGAACVDVVTLCRVVRSRDVTI